MSVDVARPRASANSSVFWIAWLAYLSFVVFGSLVPLDFHPLSLAEAWTNFQRLPLLTISAARRADWIANGVLYVPLAFLSATVLGVGKGHSLRLVAAIGALLFCATLAVAVEFVQVFFPQRTVSMNDLVAEWLGSALGATLAVFWARRIRNLLDAYLGRTRTLGPLLLTAYAFAYVAFNGFPYDFVLSGVEIEQKLISGHWGWAFADVTLLGGRFMGVLKAAGEVLAALPLGALLGRWLPRRAPFWLLVAFAAGSVLGVFIEIGQFFVVSGVSQGFSVFTRAAGVTVGAMLWQSAMGIQAITVQLRRLLPALVALYFLILAGVNGWFGSGWGGTGLAAEKLAALRFVPFYYHYFTSEAAALVSLTAVALMYAPIGLFAWAVRAEPLHAAATAALAAGVVEVEKLFIETARPDPTDVLIAAFSAWTCAHLLGRFGGRSAPPTEASQPYLEAPADTDGGAAARHLDAATSATQRSASRADVDMPCAMGSVAAGDIAWRQPSVYAVCGLLLVLAAVAWGVAGYPIYREVLGLSLAAYSLLAWRYPPLILAAIPATLPVLDLAMWSGRFYLDEFDFLLAISLAVGYLRVPPAPRGFRRDGLFVGVAMLVGVSFVVGAARGLLPWQGLDANSFTNYYSHYNAIRIAKGALWAFLLLGLLHRLAAAGRDIIGLFAWGMVVGLAGTVAVTTWERLSFSGLFNLASDYRVTGPFSQMHTGGAYIEGFLSAAVPFLFLCFLRVRRGAFRLAALVLFLATTYALMVTFSRNGYAAFGVALVLSSLAAIRQALVARTRPVSRGLAVMALAVAGLAVAVPIFQGQFAQERLSTISADLGVRRSHWADALRMRDQDELTALLGMGIGRYPETHFWRSEESRSATYRLLDESANTFLRLGSGDSIYVEQIVAVLPQRDYVLSLDVRSHGPGSSITVPVCEKWLLASYNCVWTSIKIEDTFGAWIHLERQIGSGEIASGRWYARRPVWLSLYNPNPKLVVDVDNVRLQASDGHDLLANGDFSRGLDRWYFSTDSHLPWHIKNLPVSILFDQGWLGVISLGLLVALALGRAARTAWGGDFAAGAVLASLSGFLVVGLFDSLIDTPRFLFLFLLLAWLGVLAERKTTP
jgi:VanZ family protein